MFAPQWVCRRCTTALMRPLQRQLVRQASTDATQAAIPAILLARARNMAAEHTALGTSLAETFNPSAARRLGELSRVATALKDYEKAQASMAELSSLMTSGDAELRQLAKDESTTTMEQLSSFASALSAALTPRDPYGHLPCLVEIRPGPGGLEGCYFADALFRMYRQFCARMGFRTTIVKYEVAEGSDASVGEVAITEAVLEVVNDGAYDLFRGEAGMHRVQRVPATEKSGRTHTSAVAVWVLPSFPESSSMGGSGGGSGGGGGGGGEGQGENVNDPNSDFYIDVNDVRTDKMRASGAGGQHVNKTESAIRLTHLPTGTVVSMQESRSQHRNRDEAWRLLRSRVAAQRREEREERAAAMRDSVLSRDRITRGDKIRTYNYSQDRCTDHRSGMDVHNLPDVLQGGDTLEKVIESAKEWRLGRDVQVLIAEEEAAAARAATEGKGEEVGRESKRKKR